MNLAAELLSHPAYLWLMTGAAGLSLELFLAPGVGFLFAGLAAMAVGLLVEARLLDDGAGLLQLGAFLLFTAVWAAVLWVPMKRFLRPPSGGKEYSDLIGAKARVEAPGLVKGRKGQVRWSGTLMNAELDAASSELPEGAQVVIVGVSGNTVRVTSAD
jgi:membrane protein implicated in regulation of membrane protease activity